MHFLGNWKDFSFDNQGLSYIFIMEDNLPGYGYFLHFLFKMEDNLSRLQWYNITLIISHSLTHASNNTETIMILLPVLLSHTLQTGSPDHCRSVGNRRCQAAWN